MEMHAIELPELSKSSVASSADRRADRVLRVAVIASVLILFLTPIYYWYAHPLRTEADQAIYIEMSRMMLEGKVPYRDFIDWNPPLIMYMCMIPSLVAKLFNVTSIMTFNLFVLAQCLVSALLVCYMAYKHMDKDDLFIVVPMIFMFIQYNMTQSYDYGEREQLFILTYFPFLILRGLTWREVKVSRTVATVCGVIAGFGLALKPQFVLTAAVVELFFLVRHRRLNNFWSPEIKGVVAVFALYLLLLLTIPLDAWSVFFFRIMPLYTYGLHSASKSFMFMMRGDSPMETATVVFTTGMLLAFLYKKQTLWMEPIAAFTLLGFFNYFYGQQAWVYRLMPMEMGGYFLIACAAGLLLRWIARITKSPAWLKRTSAFLLIFVVSTYAIVSLRNVLVADSQIEAFDLNKTGYPGFCNKEDMEPLVHSLCEHSNVGDKIIFMGWGINPGYAAILQANRRCGSRYLFATILIVDHCINLYHNTFWSDMAKEMIQQYLDDIRKNKPRMIIIEKWGGMKDVLTALYFFDSQPLKDYRYAGVEYDQHIYIRDDLLVAQNAGKDVDDLRERVLAEYARKKLTVKDLARNTGIEKQTIQKWIDDFRKQAVRNKDLKYQIQVLTEELRKSREEVEDLKRQLGK